MKDIEIKSLSKLLVLLLLGEQERYGYEIMKEIEKRIGKKPSPGQIYPFLRQLKKYNYMTSSGRGERDKLVYYITPEGRVFVKHILNKFGNLFEIAIRPNLKICAQCYCEVYKGAYTKKIKGRNRTFCCKDCAKNYIV